MASEWREVRVEDIKSSAPSALATGPFGSAIGSRFFRDSGVPVLRGSNLSEDVGRRLVEDDLAFLSPEKASEFRRSIARRGDLVFTCWGTIGQVGLVDDRSRFSEYIVSNKQMKLTPDPSKADSLFLYYLFSNPQMVDRIRGARIGSSVPGFNLGQLRQLPLLLPPLAEQRRVAGILGALDDKIELNRRMSQTLESMARALFKSWFVDFDPVRAKAEGRDPGLPWPVAHPFPDSLEDSELGEIPKGWGLRTVGSIADVVDCSHAKKPERRDNGRPLLQLANIRLDGVLDMSDQYLIDDADYETWTVRIEASPGDCVITNVGRVGAVAQIPRGLRAALGRNMTAVRCRRDWAYPTFLVEALRCGAMLDEISRKTDAGTILDALNVRSIPILRVVVPSQGILAGFEAAARPLRAAMEAMEQQSASLQTLRDGLLPGLLAGGLSASGEARDAVRAAS